MINIKNCVNNRWWRHSSGVVADNLSEEAKQSFSVMLMQYVSISVNLYLVFKSPRQSGANHTPVAYNCSYCSCGLPGPCRQLLGSDRSVIVLLRSHKSVPVHVRFLPVSHKGTLFSASSACFRPAASVVSAFSTTRCFLACSV